MRAAATLSSRREINGGSGAMRKEVAVLRKTTNAHYVNITFANGQSDVEINNGNVK